MAGPRKVVCVSSLASISHVWDSPRTVRGGGGAVKSGLFGGERRPHGPKRLAGRTQMGSAPARPRFNFPRISATRATWCRTSNESVGLHSGPEEPACNPTTLHDMEDSGSDLKTACYPWVCGTTSCGSLTLTVFYWKSAKKATC